MVTYTKTVGPSGADFTSITAWQSSRLGARGGDPALNSGDIEVCVLKNQTLVEGVTLSTSWPAGVTCRIQGENSHLGDWAVTAQGARVEATSSSNAFLFSGTYNAGVVFEFRNFVCVGHASTAGRLPYVCLSGGITIAWDKMLVYGGGAGGSAFAGFGNSTVVALNATNSVFTRIDGGTNRAFHFNWNVSYYDLTARGCFIRDIYAHQASPGAVNLTLYSTLMELAASPNGAAKNATDSICTAAWTGWTTINCSVGAFVTGAPSSGQVGFTDLATYDYSLYDDANNLAIDFATNEATLTEDATGAARPARGDYDAGAFELATAITDAPTAPSDLAGSALTVSSVALTWTDNSSGTSAEASFEIQRRDAGSSGAWTVVDDAIAANATGYNVTGLTTGSHEFRIRATNVIGSSDWSATATVATRSYKATDSKAVGVNMDKILDYMVEYPWKDIILSMRAWEAQYTDGSSAGSPDLDANNNPQSIGGDRLRGVLSTVLGDMYPGEEWALLYDGDGLGRFSIGNTVTVSSVQGRHVFTMNSGNIWIDITSINASDKMRNLRCVRVSDESTYVADPWRNEFLNSWGAVRAIRFSNWTRQYPVTDDSPDWADRPTTSYRGRKWGEVPYERIIDLCTRLDVDCWLTIPHVVSDDFVTQMATLFEASFPAGRKIYIEYSNECWNPLFEAYDYCMTQAAASSDPVIAAIYGTNIYEGQAAWYGLRVKEVMDIWSGVFVGQESRIVRILAGQSVGSFIDWAFAYPGLADSLDAVSLAPYVGDQLYADPGIELETNEAILAMLDDELTTKLAVRTQALIDNYRDVYGLRVIAYEGGQHMTPPGAGAIHDKFLSVNRDAGMRDFTYNYLTAWHTTSDDLFCWYKGTSSYSIYGYWGLRESELEDRTTSPKLDGLLDYIEANTASGSAVRRHALRLGLGLR